jgi:hypothetical protein
MHFTGSWEFVINLDYEWSVIRGRRQYLRTIWVRSHKASRLGFALPAEGVRTDLLPHIGLLTNTRGHPYGRHRQHDRF